MESLHQTAKSRNILLSKQLDAQILRIKQFNSRQPQQLEAKPLMQPFQILQQKLRTLEQKLLKVKQIDLTKYQQKKKYNYQAQQSSARSKKKKNYQQCSSDYQSTDNKINKIHTSNKNTKRKQQENQEQTFSIKELTHTQMKIIKNSKIDIKQYQSHRSNKSNPKLTKAVQSLNDIKRKQTKFQTLNNSQNKKNTRISSTQQKIIRTYDDQINQKKMSTKNKTQRIFSSNVQSSKQTTNHNSQINTPQKKQRRIVSSSADGLKKKSSTKNYNNQTIQALNKKLENIQKLYKITQEQNQSQNKLKSNNIMESKNTTYKKTKENTPSKRKGDFAIEDKQSQFKLLPKNYSIKQLNQMNSMKKLNKKSAVSLRNKNVFSGSNRKNSKRKNQINLNDEYPKALTDQKARKSNSKEHMNQNNRQMFISHNYLSKSKRSQYGGTLSHTALHRQCMNNFNQPLIPLKQKKILERQMKEFAKENLQLKNKVSKLHKFQQEYWKMKEIFEKYQKQNKLWKKQ